MKKKAILILGASNDQLFMINTAHEMGLETVVVDGNKDAIGLKIATYSKEIDFSNTEKVINYAQELIDKNVNLSGVLTMGSDVPHIIAKIAKHFSWVGPSIETAIITTDKFLMKETFRKNSISVPNYALIDSHEEILKYSKQWNSQSIIIKPIDAAGSRGVSILNDLTHIQQLYMHAKENSKSGRVLIEEYIEGPQISTESVIYDGKYFHPGFADRVYDETKNFYPYIMENGGWQPSRLDDAKYHEICLLIEKVAKAIKLDRGIIKGDIVYSTKYKKTMVIEVASRLSGGDFSASLVPLAHGINYIKTAIQIAINSHVDLTELDPKFNNIVANRYFFVPQGILNSIQGLEKLSTHTNIAKIEFNYKLNSRIPKIENHGQRVGVFIVSDTSYAKVQETINTVYDTVSFVVDGKSYSGHPKYYKLQNE